jgi:hypothetical protein
VSMLCATMSTRNVPYCADDNGTIKKEIDIAIFADHHSENAQLN